ncbi:MAG: helix-turn-helix transcriptional regulator [Nevskiales bacterium]|nr:helix-turn-helix transcriptional regulator [Nevskiales bacterium]
MKNCVRERRQQRGWTQQDLARLLGVSRQTVNAIENGKYDPSLPLAFQLGALFECRIEDLFDPRSA